MRRGKNSIARQNTLNMSHKLAAPYSQCGLVWGGRSAVDSIGADWIAQMDPPDALRYAFQSSAQSCRGGSPFHALAHHWNKQARIPYGWLCKRAV